MAFPTPLQAPDDGIPLPTPDQDRVSRAIAHAIAPPPPDPDDAERQADEGWRRAGRASRDAGSSHGTMPDDQPVAAGGTPPIGLDGAANDNGPDDATGSARNAAWWSRTAERARHAAEVADGRRPEPPSLNEADARIFRTDSEDALARSGVPAERMEHHRDAIHAGLAEAHRRLRREGLSDRDARIAVLGGIPRLGATLAGLDDNPPMAPANDDGRDGKVVALNPWQLAADLEAIPGLAGHVYVARLPIEDDAPSQGGWIHWIQDGNRFTGALPVIVGRQGVERAIARMKETGHTIIAKEVVFDIRGAGNAMHRTIRIDLVAIKPDGKAVVFVEVKTGPHAKATPNQNVGITALESGRAIPVGPGGQNLVEILNRKLSRDMPAFKIGEPLPPAGVVVMHLER